MEVSEAALTQMFASVMPLLDERQRRTLAGAQARALGRGGIGVVARAAAMSRSTVQKAVAEVDAGVDPAAPVRRAGAGRKKLIDKDPDLLLNLDQLVEPTARGDPMCPLRWTSKSTGHLADALVAKGHQVSADTVGRLLRAMDYSLQATAKQVEGAQHPDRGAQFVYLTGQVGAHLRAGQPVISVDTKKKEVVGQRGNGGTEYTPKGRPERSTCTTSRTPRWARRSPSGFTTSPPTKASSPSAMTMTPRRSPWPPSGGGGTWSVRSPTQRRRSSDAGGSNGYRVRLWKLELGRLAARAGIDITVCLFPPGTSKWSKIEHRLCSAVTSNWRGRPLTSHEIIVNLIGATTNRAGLKVRAHLDTCYYPQGVKVTNAELAAVPSPATTSTATGTTPCTRPHHPQASDDLQTTTM